MEQFWMQDTVLYLEYNRTHISNRESSTLPTSHGISTQSFSKDQFCLTISHTSNHHWMGLGLFFTTPAFIYIFKGPWNKLSKYSALAILCILPPLITHGTVGFTQFGYRFSLDFTPFLILLTAKGMRENLRWLEKALIILSLLVNLWGVVSIIKFNFVSF